MLDRGAPLPSLTSLRWFAASIVFLRHGQELLAAGSETLQGRYARVADQGPTGVSFFFILSGFVLAWSRRPADTAREFYRRRFARIAPAYWVACLLAFGSVVLIDGKGEIWKSLFPLTFLQSWVPDSSVYYGGTPVAWSLSTEVAFYAAFPLLIGPLMRLDRRALKRILGVVIAVSIVTPLAIGSGEHNTGAAFWAIYINPTYRILEFVAGICLCALLLCGQRVRVTPPAAAAVAVAAYLAAGTAPVDAMWVAVTLIPFCLLIFVCAQSDSDGRRGLLHHAWLLRLGQWSFAFYLLHHLVIVQVARLDDELPAGDVPLVLLVLAAYVVATIAAYLLFRIVERPLEQRIRGTALRRDRVLGEEPAGAAR